MRNPEKAAAHSCFRLSKRTLCVLFVIPAPSPLSFPHPPLCHPRESGNPESNHLPTITTLLPIKPLTLINHLVIPDSDRGSSSNAIPAKQEFLSLVIPDSIRNLKKPAHPPPLCHSRFFFCHSRTRLRGHRLQRESRKNRFAVFLSFPRKRESRKKPLS